jgi:Flp pilus assembly protein TadD
VACGAFVGFCFEGSAFERGLNAFKRHDLRTAEREFVQAVSDQPNSARVWKLLGMTYIAEERYEPAENPAIRSAI